MSKTGPEPVNPSPKTGKPPDGHTDSGPAAEEIRSGLRPRCRRVLTGVDGPWATHPAPNKLRPSDKPEKSMIRALRSNQFWLTAAYLGSLLLMARGYA